MYPIGPFESGSTKVTERLSGRPSNERQTKLPQRGIACNLKPGLWAGSIRDSDDTVDWSRVENKYIAIGDLG